MHTKRFKIVLLLLAIGLVVFFGSSHWQPAQAVGAVAAHEAMIQEYCIGCHNQKAKTADISLEGLDYQNVAKNGDTWEKVLRKVRTGQIYRCFDLLTLESRLRQIGAFAFCDNYKRAVISDDPAISRGLFPVRKI